MADNGAILQVAGVVKDFSGTRALDHVTLTLGAGEVHALIGQNGAGKSTLVNVLAGIHRPDAGTLRLRGLPVVFSSPANAQRAGIGTVHQDAALVPQMSVARNLFLGREPRHHGLIGLRRMNTEAGAIMAGLGVHIDVRRPLGSFGAGVRRLALLARVISADVPVVVLDEPTAGLEPDEVERLFAVIARLRSQGRSVLYVSHRLAEIERICDRVTVLRDGRVVHTGRSAGLDRLRLVSLMLGREVTVATTVLGALASESADPPILEATGLTKRHVLTDVSIELRQGEVLGLSGLLRAGRSETARAIAGAMPLDSGQVTISGTRLRTRSVSAAIRAGVGLLPEDRKAEGIIAALSIRDNIVLAALPRLARAGIVSNARLDRIAETFVKRLHIKATSVHQPVAELSGGSQQKVLLARWLAANPRVLMLDEPTRGLDVGTKADVKTLIDDLAVDGLAVMLISSDMEELAGTCDRVVVLRDGAVFRRLNGPDVTEKNIMSLLAAR